MTCCNGEKVKGWVWHSKVHAIAHAIAHALVIRES